MKSISLIIALLCFTNFAWGQTDKIEELRKQLDIVELNNSPYDIDLRIYLDRSFTNGGQVLWIRKDEESWIGTKFDYFLKIKRNGEVGRIKKINKTNLSPKDSWTDLWTSLKEQNISDLPNQDEIQDKLRKEVTTKRGKGYEVIQVSDGSSYDLILKENDNLIQYSFHSPWIFADKFPEVQEVKNYSEIISRLENQLNFKFRK